MKMIDVTNSHYDLVTKQLECSDAYIVKVYTIGSTTVIFTQADTHHNIVIINKVRPIRPKEIDFVIQKLFKRTSRQGIEILDGHNFIQMELKC